MEELYYFDLHGGLKGPRMDAITHRLGSAPENLCVQKIEDIAFGGTMTAFEDDIIALYTWVFAFAGLGHHFLSLDVIGRLGFGGLDGSRDDVMWFEGDAWYDTLAHESLTHGLWRPTDLYLEAQSLTFRPHVTLLWHDITLFKVLLYVIFIFASCKSK
jgi:hypothetical protein